MKRAGWGAREPMKRAGWGARAPMKQGPLRKAEAEQGN
jgi:hypothetical protein